ncbi:MAG: hemerythrin domain-containing protein [Streptosporangiales bacterium]|nr:hemerythrin domain-containing protein [Streptosporangiales bacterium]
MGTEGKDMVNLLIEDHREIEAIFGRLESGEGTPEQRRQLANLMTAELIRHSVAEEEHLYPTARAVLDDGNKIADHEIEEHANAERLLKQLEGVAATDPEFDSLLDSVFSDVRHHIEEEEGDLFRRLRQRCSRDELLDLGAKLTAAKTMAPTRPHPAAPDRPRQV